MSASIAVGPPGVSCIVLENDADTRAALRETLGPALLADIELALEESREVRIWVEAGYDHALKPPGWKLDTPPIEKNRSLRITILIDPKPLSEGSTRVLVPGRQRQAAAGA